MDKVIQQSLGQVRQTSKNSFPWQVDQPWRQPSYSFVNQKWTHDFMPMAPQPFSSFALYSWNIDFMLPYPDSRMQQALRHLQDLVETRSGDTACVIFLQECTKSDLTYIAAHPWIRDQFYLSDLDDSNWTSGWYGTITLVDKRLNVISNFRVHYSQTIMERDAFFTDLQFGDNVVRLCNSHLESMAFEPPRRPYQLALIARYMHESQGAVVAGDFNAIQDFDRTLHSDNQLKDAYLESGGVEDREDGFTWGQQASTALRNQFGLTRMDKVFFCGALQLKSFATFGADVQLENDEERENVVALGFDKPWITDHLGVKAVFALKENSEQKL